MPSHFLQKVGRVLSMHPPECAAILTSILLWPPTNLLSVDFHFPFLSILHPPILLQLLVSVPEWGNINMFVILYKHIFQTPLRMSSKQAANWLIKTRWDHGLSRKQRQRDETVYSDMAPDLQETVTNINCVYMYVWSLTKSDSPAHNLEGVVGWWQLLTHSHTQNTLVCSCGSAHAHLCEHTQERLSCIGSDEDGTNTSPNSWVILF